MSSHQTILVSRCSCRGFTLVEVIVVLLIIGVTVSLVFPRLVLPERFGDLASHSRNITSMIRLAKEESTLRGRILGIFSEGNEIKVKRLAKGEWIAYEVKSSYGISETFILDAAFQYYVISNSGLRLKDFKIIYASEKDLLRVFNNLLTYITLRIIMNI